ncbi:hypothetical protein [Niallia endozanthoxylica]|uniref:Uncharacterized protein n=1 Tax=Niallia endozanthoxylica TaxID=2036016 RepID=A0A5J5I4J5_9BACI|nr:hypothetical protein [Niallia endozanthoxylica]KAA9029983.1 hypothetical protein F4V44_02970 [Niallia endozanthoxylica]
MMAVTEQHIQNDYVILKQILKLRNNLGELYTQSGGNSSKYINLSLQLGALEKQYIEEKIKLLEEQ